MSSIAEVARKAIPVAKPYFGAEEEAAVVGALRSGWVAQGPKVAEFERRFADFVGARESVAVSSCTTALHLAMIASGIRSGDEVLCPSLSFIATANCIAYVGAKPVFVDIDPATYNLDPGRIEEAITSRTRAILAVHQIGLPADMDAINQIAGRRGLTVIEDAACAVGAEYKGAMIGRPHSRVACFSFHPRKVLTTGEGGMITTSDEKLAQQLRRLRQHAMSVSDVARHNASKVVIERYDEVGYNFRMTDMQAAVGLVQLARLPGFLERRRELAARYTRLLARFEWLILPAATPDCRHSFQSYMVRIRKNAPLTRDALMQRLLDHGISTRRGIMAIHHEAPYRDSVWEQRLPQTGAATRETIILPLFHQMTEEDQDYIIECIADAAAH